MKQRNNTRPRKRWIIIGPGIVLSMILAIQIVIANRPKPTGPPIIESQVIGSQVSQNASPTPDIGYILERRDQLKLSERQLKALTALESGWQTESKPLSDEMNRAADEFNAYMKKTGNKAAMQDLQSHAAPVSEVSRQISSLRRVYWERALQSLNEQQRQVIEKELAHGYHPKPV